MLTAGALAGGALLVGYPLLEGLRARRRSPQVGPYGSLRSAPDSSLSLPEGFSCHVIERAGDRMSDGLPAPPRADGMACFALPDGSWALMRNHENPAASAGTAWSGPVPEHAWSSDGLGGVSRVVIDPETVTRRSSNLVLGGTVLNCAGGPSPWGWLSCEETFEARHGLVFACDPLADSLAAPRPIRAYGKFRHEAVAVEASTGIAYLTEDRDDSCLYRFVPHDPTRPFDGELFALRVRGRQRYDTGRSMRVEDSVEIEWTPVLESAPQEDILRYHAHADGAAIFSRGEGITMTSEGALVFSATSGGPHQNGQVLRLEPDGDGGILSILASGSDERGGPAKFSMPDNIVASPHHGMIFFCEDNHIANGIVGIDANGSVFDFARNTLSRSELAGACFSPDGRAMFVNLQEDGLTLAIVGPWS